MASCPNDIATGRQESLFAADVERHLSELKDALSSSRVCVIGGAGSIGTATIDCLAGFDIGQLVVMDHNENALAGLTRRLQARAEKPRSREILTLPFDYGSDIGHHYFQDHGRFDYVLNFAALKHVRTEKNAYSALALIDTNVLKPALLMDWLAEMNPKAGYFSVSTDKAANPVSFMGASKRLMEHAMFGSGHAEKLTGRKVSARFANVAYSNGSLLESFAQRLQDRVPLAAPVGISRYFISQEEAGELCLLASMLGEDKQILFPKLNPEEHMIAVEEIARRFLEANGYDADVFTLDEEDDAKSAVEGLAAEGKWPLILTPADTAGEKPYEEFVGSNETTVLTPFHELFAVDYDSHLTYSEIDASLARFENLVLGDTDEPLTLETIKAAVAELEPAFAEAHKASDKQLDNRI